MCHTTPSSTTAKTSTEDHNLERVMLKIVEHKTLLRRHCIEYAGTGTKPTKIHTNRNQTSWHTFLLRTGGLGRLNRQPNPHDEDDLLSAKERKEYIPSMQERAASTTYKDPKRDQIQKIIVHLIPVLKGR